MLLAHWDWQSTYKPNLATSQHQLTTTTGPLGFAEHFKPNLATQHNTNSQQPKCLKHTHHYLPIHVSLTLTIKCYWLIWDWQCTYKPSLATSQHQLTTTTGPLGYAEHLQTTPSNPTQHQPTTTKTPSTNNQEHVDTITTISSHPLPSMHNQCLCVC